MFDTAREHYEHLWGCQNELQNAYEQSRREVRIVNMLDKAYEWRARGFFVLAEYGTVYCPRTDAALGRYYRILLATKDEARMDREILRRGIDLATEPDDWGYELLHP